jgi:alkaline phosphatase
MDPDYKMLIGYAANADRKEDWLTNPLPLQDSQQPEGSASYASIKSLLPANPLARDANGFTITGHIDGIAHDIAMGACDAGICATYTIPAGSGRHRADAKRRYRRDRTAC